MEGLIMRFDLTSMLHIAKPDYVPPAQLLHQSLDQDMPYWMRHLPEADLHKPVPAGDQEARRMLNLLDTEEKLHRSSPSSNNAQPNL